MLKHVHYPTIAGAALLFTLASPQQALAGVPRAPEVSVVQQTVKVKGVVTDKNGQPLVGASVYVKGAARKVAMTDVDGKFELAVAPGDQLTVSYVGYKSVTVPASTEPITVTLEEDNQLNEVVVVGYGSTTKRDLIASVSTVKADQIANIPVANLAQGLAGRSPGLIVNASGGGINSTPSISIRGGGEPLYVIDGVVRSKADFVNLSPDDIASMSILKDASATAVYGSRASNGIVQVVTKQGKEGKATVEYDFNYSLSQPGVWPKKMSAYDRALQTNVAFENDGREPYFSEDALKAFLDGSDPLNYSNTDWRKLVLNNWAPQTKHTVRLTGGGENNQYYLSLGHIYQNSLYKSDTHYMKRTNFRAAQKSYIEAIGLHVNTTIDGYREMTTHPYTSTASGYYQVFSHINDRPPYLPGVNKYGLPYNVTDNPVAETAKDAGYIRGYDNVINGKADLIWDCLWVKGLKVRLSGNYRYYGETSKQWRKDAAQYDWESTAAQYANKPQLYQSSSTGTSFTTQAFLEYANTFGKHTISALAGYERYYEKGQTYWLQRTDYDFDIDQIGPGNANNQTNGGSEAELGRAAFIAQAKYNYDNKYYGEASMRYDGSDYFAPGKRWGAFFSTSLGWVVTAENFMQPLVERNILNNLKIRASYGETGLDNSAGRFAYLTSYNLNTQGYVVGGQYVPGFSEGSLPSPDLTWYTTKQTDIGFDFASLNSRLYGSFDYFYYTTKGYLVAPTGDSYLSQIIGISMPKVKSNSEYRRAGFDATLGWRDHVGEFTYDISANFTYYRSLWARIDDEAVTSYMNPYSRQAQQKNTYYGVIYHNLGYYQSAQDVLNSAGALPYIGTGYVTAGDIKYEDTNGNGRIDGEDARRLGHQSSPLGQYGITINLGYKGFYLSALFQGSTSFDMYIPGTASMQTQQAGVMPVQYEYQLDYWTPSNRDAMYPRLMSNTGLNGNNNYLTSDFWLVNGRYLRMKDFQFGYDFKYSLLKNLTWLSKVRVGISGQNIFTISKATKYGLDPENSSTAGYGYPVERTIAFTLNLGF